MIVLPDLDFPGRVFQASGQARMQLFFSKPELFFDTILLVLGYLGTVRDSHVVRVVENRARVRVQDIANVIYVYLCTM